MKGRSPRVWLVDIRDEIAGIQNLTRGTDLASFSASWAMKRAIEHALLIIAEAAKNLPSSMKDARPEVVWQKIHALGNLLRHEYRHVDPEILWSIVNGTPLLDLDKAVTVLLQSLDEASKD
jgi:uncharacterized protein with HEPN domain